MKYTKGLWKVRNWDGEEWPEKRWSVGPDNGNICEAVCISPRYDSNKGQANARLIASAPELLEACKNALTEWTLHGSLTDTAREIRQAISEATGQEEE